MKHSLLVFTLALGISRFVLASNCSTVNFIDHFQKTFNQNDIGWCYAYSAADLVSFKNRSNLNGKSVSPLHLALLQNLNEAESFNKEAGIVKAAIRLATVRFDSSDRSGFFRGVCLADVDEKLASRQPHLGFKKQFYQLAELKKKYDDSVKIKNAAAFLDYYALLGKDNSPITYLVPSDLKQLLDSSNNRNIGIGYLDLFCPLDSRFKSPQPEYPLSFAVGDEINIGQKVGPSLRILIKNSKQVLDEVHAQLDLGNVSSIQYYSDFLTNESAIRNSGVYHASTVVGREFLNGSCHIIVRNSWGGCNDSAGNSKYSKNITKCKDGNLWIAEEKLLGQLDGITYIKKHQ